jgi:hypothetical protein
MNMFAILTIVVTTIMVTIITTLMVVDYYNDKANIDK